MKLYASMETNGQGGWGDSFPALFFTEWLKQHDETDSLEIWLWDQGAQGTGGAAKFRHRDHIEKPAWIAGWIDEPPTIKDNFDIVLATHYNHPQKPAPITSDKWDPHFGGWLPPAIYEGADLGIIRLHNDAFWATLIDKLNWRPTLPLIFIPPMNIMPTIPYIAIQLRRQEPGYDHKPGRNALQGVNFDRWARNYIHKFDDPVVLLSDQVETDHPNVIDASKCTLWQKIYLAAHAESFHGAHSGFGGICASYAKSSFVINPSQEGIRRNPPLVVFGNVTCPKVIDTYTAQGPYIDYPGDLEISLC